MSFNELFKGRHLLIASKHKKEEVISPLFEKELGVKCFISMDFDTDIFGTFTGEIEREFDPITSARQKCIHGMEITNCDLVIASEGSFGAHPSIYFAPADDEFLIFIDKKNGLEITVRELSLNTNFNGEEIYNIQELEKFANKVAFPTHGLILRTSKNSTDEIFKGINTWDSLYETFTYLRAKNENVFIETDMRAMYNPTRMSVIELAAKKLLDKIKSCCPQCQTPGFGITEVQQGLPCSNCGAATRSTLCFIYQCVKCSARNIKMYPNNKTEEDPMYCDHCNP